MDFDYTDEQKQLANAVSRYLDKEYGFEARKAILRTVEGYSGDVWRQFAELGLLALPLPEECGGFAGGAVDMMPIMEAMGVALVVEPYLATILCARLLAGAGSPTRTADLLPAVASGGLKLALAHAEPTSRYRRTHVRTTARRDGAGWRLDGDKSMVVHGALANLLLVSARTEGEDDAADGISLFLVPAEAAGMTQRAFRTVDGMVACDLRLEGVRLGEQDLLGVPGQAHASLDEALDFATALCCAEAVGIIGYANAQTVDYLKTRRQFGKSIGTNQALQHRMVELMITHEQARSMACLACVKVDTETDPRQRARAVSAAQIRIAQACRLVSQESVQMHGGIGMTEELKLSHCFRRLLVLSQQFGDVDFHLERFARLDRELQRQDGN
jgi:alkylation response protein AidB-like acyl-CoA dehydrogenase